MTDAPHETMDAADSVVEWLAEHLFGWKHGSGPLSQWWITPPGAHVSPIGWTCYLKSWSETGDGMLLVMEAMRERGYLVELVSHAQTLPAYIWGVEFADVERSYETAYSASAPMAVAKAAKRALEDSVRGDRQ
jgi:hypothetical protein